MKDTILRAREPPHSSANDLIVPKVAIRAYNTILLLQTNTIKAEHDDMAQLFLREFTSNLEIPLL